MTEPAMVRTWCSRWGIGQRHWDLNGDTIIAQYRVTANADVADPASEVVLLKIAQPFANHNGGQLRFGPDGFLYVAMGDGGSAGDPNGSGQNLGSMLGKLLRIDVESDPGRVRIPPDNPFVNTAGARGEVWAYGLRNPWRFSFDRATRDLWIGDVGQNAFEEVDFQPASSRGGENYSWNAMEGLHCYREGCQAQGFTLPVAEYTHGEGCSVTGGFVYRGRLSPGLRGIYLYGDYCSGRIWGVERDGDGWTNRQLLASGFSISTSGEDEDGEVYVADAANGTVHRIAGSRAPRFSASAVVNAASFAGGLVAGSLASGVRGRGTGRCWQSCGRRASTAGNAGGSVCHRSWNSGAAVLGRESNRPGAGDLPSAVGIGGPDGGCRSSDSGRAGERGGQRAG